MLFRSFIELTRPLGWIRGKHVLVVDDVNTTGTTLDLCAFVLKKAGACRVTRFSLAYQVMKSFDGKADHSTEEGKKVEPFLLHFPMQVGEEVAGRDVQESSCGDRQRTIQQSRGSAVQQGTQKNAYWSHGGENEEHCDG